MHETESPLIHPAHPSDADAVARIYSHFVSNTVATFEERPVSAEEMAARLAATQAASLPWLVAEVGGAVVGYASASKWKGRCAYRYTVETSVYVDPRAHGWGVGEALLRSLLADLRAKGYHSLLAGIALPNVASVRLHEKLGFRKVAHFAEVGWKFGAWVDVGYWQLLLASRPPE